MKQGTTSARRVFSTLLALMLTMAVFAQKETVSGTVIDSQNEPVIGATVMEIGTQNGTATDIDGHFSLSVKPGTMLRISYVGFKTLEVKATKGMTVELVEESNTLNEVVAIGYGSVKRKDVTTAVSSVSTEDLDTRPIVSAVSGMQGKAAGLQISQANGQPGSSPTVRVRGTTSLNGSNNPLYVVDGVPLTDIDYLSADDIESIQVLKDASSAAIYGSRAANGVIIISTKQGQKGVAKVSLNAHVSANTVRNNQTPLNAQQYKELQDEIGLVKLPNNLTDQTDWADEVYRTGIVQDYQLSITNGNDKLRYYISGGYTGESGVLKSSNFDRYNVRAVIDNDINKWLTINASAAYSDYTYKGTGIISGTGSNRGGVVTSIINTPTYAPVWDASNPGQYYNNFYGVNITSPAENLSRTEDNKTSYNKFLGSGKATITFLPETLTLTSQFTFDRTQGTTMNFLDPKKTGNGRDNYGTGYDSRSINTVMVWDNILNFKKQFGIHGLDVMVGSSWTGSKYSNNWINGSNYADADIKTLNAANKISWTGTGSSASDWAIMSYFARASYNLKDTYLLTANVRADGSSKLAPGHRWGYFPSFSAAWRVSEEKFMKDIEWLDDLKIRGGWGQTGNQSGLGDYSYLASYDINRIQWFGEGYDANAVPTRSQSTLSNPELTWETTSQTDIGLDITVLNNRLTFTADYYYKKTTDMLMTVTLPAGSAAATSLTYNGGDVVNKGWEFSISSKNLVGKFSWNTDFNISFNRNKLTKLMLTQVYYSAKTTDYVNDYVVRNTPGKPLGSFWGYISDGVDPETGELMYRDVNKDGIISASDRTYIGDPNPDFTYGLTNTFKWNGLALSVLIQGSYGNDIYNVSKMETQGMYDGKNQTTAVLNRWQVPGQITTVPKAGFDMKNSTYFLEDGSYLRVKDISLSYDIPRNIINKIHLTRLMPYISATNLFTITGYKGMDPEVNQYGNSGAVQGIDWGTYPMCRSFVFGLKVEF
jgi:TonB-dependent starch-binding outer membrane protein SusC